MNLNTKIPPPPRLPKGLLALVRGPRLAEASTPLGAKPRAIAEPDESTRAWKPDRSLLQPARLPASKSAFALAADEQTVVGATNLRDPSLFRSEPPPALIAEAMDDGATREDTTIDFVGALTSFSLDEPQPTTASVCGEEHTQLYRPQRAHLPPEEITDEFEAAVAPEGASVVGPEPPKVIIAPAVLADSAPDPARAEATKKRRTQRGTDTKLGLALCLLGGAALALSVAWRHPRTAPLTHDAFAKVAAAVASLHGK
jgi:hypothetical protein